jgi:hypothetical protein
MSDLVIYHRGEDTATTTTDDDEATKHVFTLNQLSTTYKALRKTDSALENFRLKKAAACKYVSWMDMQFQDFDASVGTGDATAAPPLRPFRSRVRALELPPCRRWDLVRFEIEHAMGLHPDIRTSATTTPAGAVFGFRLSVVERYRKQTLQTSNQCENPFTRYGGVNERSLAACQWLMRDDVIEDNETIVVARWPVQPPFKGYVPDRFIASSSTNTAPVTVGAVASEPVVTTLKRKLEDCSASDCEDEDEKLRLILGILKTAPPPAIATTAPRRPTVKVLKHYGDLVYMTWAKPSMAYECKRCEKRGDHFVVACPFWNVETNTPTPNKVHKVTGIPKSFLRT